VISSMRIETTFGIDAPDHWNSLANASDAHFFQGAVWSSLIVKNQLGADAVWITAFHNDIPVGGLVAIVANRLFATQLISSYQGTLGGPFSLASLTDTEKTEVDSLLLKEFVQHASHKKVISSAVYSSSSAAKEVLCSAGFQERQFSGAVVDLAQGYDFVEMNLIKKNRRNERNRSMKRGCTTGVTVDPKIIDEYYPLYLKAVQRWKVEPVSEQFLRDLLAFSDGDAFMSIVRLEGKLIGGHINLSSGGITTAWNGATDLDLKDVFPASVLIFTDVAEACNRGCAVLDLGAHGGVKGVEQFKRMFGAESDSRKMYLKESMIKTTYDKVMSLINGGL
jgi:predicted N-acyltransferase